MKRRHEDQLLNRLEGLFSRGVCSIAWSELYTWFGLSKITKKTWRELWDRWIEIVDVDGTLGEEPRKSPLYQKWLEENAVDLIETRSSEGIVLVYRSCIAGTLSDREFL